MGIIGEVCCFIIMPLPERRELFRFTEKTEERVPLQHLRNYYENRIFCYLLDILLLEYFYMPNE